MKPHSDGQLYDRFGMDEIGSNEASKPLLSVKVQICISIQKRKSGQENLDPENRQHCLVYILTLEAGFFVQNQELGIPELSSSCA